MSNAATAPVEIDDSLYATNDRPKYMRVPRPRGAPNIGDRIQYTDTKGKVLTGRCALWLSEQFVLACDGAGLRIPVLIKEDSWKVIEENG
jgi:hypothetical protein